jgi:hypothetical protein
MMIGEGLVQNTKIIVANFDSGDVCFLQALRDGGMKAALFAASFAHFLGGPKRLA